ncbi:hypothetical protein [Halorhabdus rudnickae]|uniref:hypothetical protein n=1 Tax=Halorhabdus rudnickae TaxID=1775544 RepID=UPI00108324AE|nr:hypothetical protein [Halorhabdus rudnickae]
MSELATRFPGGYFPRLGVGSRIDEARIRQKPAEEVEKYRDSEEQFVVLNDSCADPKVPPTRAAPSSLSITS